MKAIVIGILGAVVAAMLSGCAPQPPPQQLVVQRPDEQKPQIVTFPNRNNVRRRIGEPGESAWPSSSSTPTITT